ncbi:MAG: anthranilate synthase component I family protein [Cytophagales bacterium]
MYKVKTTIKETLADEITPVSIFLALRDKYPRCILLESSDYHGTQDIYSYICCDPIIGVELQNDVWKSYDHLGNETIKKIQQKGDVTIALKEFLEQFETSENDLDSNCIKDGVFGYMSYDCVKHFEDIDIQTYPTEFRKIPDLQYHFYRYILAFNHFNNRLLIIENHIEGDSRNSELERIAHLIKSKTYSSFPFELFESEDSNFNDEEFLNILEKGKYHCRRGDVFQIVLSRRFSQQYSGDDFNVYRSLRSINPSPYLFYFDYGSFRIFGSSPEAQIVVKNGKATIFPIAGTFKRSGNDIKDYDLAKKLLNDPKESAEHVMLVDLARNDLSRHCDQVKVETFKEVQYYSHVIHLVSKVSGRLENKGHMLEIVGDTFPAGTLSGAPKHMAMKIINQLEHGNRGFYGGAIGHIGFNGSFNHAIMIRTVMSKNNLLFYQAGAGVVQLSDIHSELQEVHNKLAALKKAIVQAQTV